MAHTHISQNLAQNNHQVDRFLRYMLSILFISTFQIHSNVTDCSHDGASLHSKLRFEELFQGDSASVSLSVPCLWQTSREWKWISAGVLIFPSDLLSVASQPLQWGEYRGWPRRRWERKYRSCQAELKYYVRFSDLRPQEKHYWEICIAQHLLLTMVTVFTVVVTAVVTEAWQGDMSDQLLLISRGVKLQSWLLSN